MFRKVVMVLLFIIRSPAVRGWHQYKQRSNNQLKHKQLSAWREAIISTRQHAVPVNVNDYAIFSINVQDFSYPEQSAHGIRSHHHLARNLLECLWIFT
ncbi:MAG: hypothetical protein IPG80_15610 [Anaerolineales bacterium]|uniref:hypothetical protein n=1 Tax=Candidatus Villigracilis vicinus TaxID=3140679 RepID=UPI003136D668|nr:hypothetical protein [Anaerolineales bacterium]